MVGVRVAGPLCLSAGSEGQGGKGEQYRTLGRTPKPYSQTLICIILYAEIRNINAYLSQAGHV